MSFFFKLDARTKLIFILLFTVLVFLIDRLPVSVLLLFSCIALRLAARIPFHVIRLFKNLTLLALFIILVQALFGPGTDYIIKIGEIISVKREGFFLGLVIVCSLASLVILLPVFTETTSPSGIAFGLYSLGLNYRIAFIITFAFNLIPFFREEANSIMDAQKLRGMRAFGITSLAGLLVPLMLNAMRKAQVSSVAMDCRAFGIYKTRTWSGISDKQPARMTKNDFLFIMACVVFSACMLFFNFF